MTLTAPTPELDRRAADALLEHFSRREGDVIALARSLVEIESPSGD